MIERENYAVFCEDEITIMFDKKSGAFSEVMSLQKGKEENYDNIYREKFSTCKQIADTFAGEGPRLGRLSFLTTQCCNLACKYCFANSGTYNADDDIIMSVEMMKKAFTYLCVKYKEGIDLVHFFGGEPMLGYENIKNFVPWCYDFCQEQEIIPPVFSIVSNGTVMNSDIFEFFNRFRVNIVVSIDGNKELNDQTRISSMFESVYDIICKNFAGLPRERTFKIGCEMTLNKNHIKAYQKGIVKEWLDDICSIGFDYATVGVAETAQEECRITEEEKHILQDIELESINYFFDRLMKADRFKSVEIVGLIRQLSSHKKALPCGAGYHSLTVKPNGDILPCYQFYKDHNFDMGNVEKEDTKKFETIKNIFKDSTLSQPEKCNNCWLNGYCTVQCKGFSYNSYGELNHAAASRCWMLSAAIRSILANLVKLKKNKRDYEKFLERLYEFNQSYTYNKAEGK